MTFSTPKVMKVLKHLRGEMSREDLQDVEPLQKSYIQPVLASKVIEMTIPERPTSSKQKYRISAAGKQILGNANETNATKGKP